MQAVPITLTFTGTDVNYSLDGQQATGDFTVVFHADTSNVDLFPFPEIPSYEGLTGTITLSGVGVGTFGSAYVFNNQFNETVGFGTADKLDVYDLRATGQGLATYGLTTNFGPISTTDIRALDQWDTTLGNLTLFSVREGTFQATTASVAEPGSLALLGLGLLGFGLTRRSL